MTMAASAFGRVDADGREPREVAALTRGIEWLNSPRLTPADLLGKVVLVNFCTYTCINWLRTLPYVRAWARAYGPDLVVIGVHTPEFSFEHDVANVRLALQQLKVTYPVVIDNDYAIWRAFGNQYWPAAYFLDAKGHVRERHFGEGEYEWSENVIRRLLMESEAMGHRDRFATIEASGVEAAADWATLRSPENYLGSARTENHSSSPTRLALNQWALAGTWARGREAIVTKAPHARLVNRFHARDLHLVMGLSRGSAAVPFRVSIDGQPPGMAHGLDVDIDGNGTVREPRLYQLIRQPMPIVDRTFAIEFLDAGVEACAFTFG